MGQIGPLVLVGYSKPPNEVSLLRDAQFGRLAAWLPWIRTHWRVVARNYFSDTRNISEQQIDD